MRILLFAGIHKIKTCITILLSIWTWLVRTTEINKDAIPTIWTPHTCHKISLRFCLSLAYCTNHGFGPELERALDSTAVMMESGDKQYCMDDGFFYNLKHAQKTDETATKVMYKTSNTDTDKSQI